MANQNDVIRDHLLRKLYEFHRSAKSPRSTARGIRDIQSAMREDGYRQQEVAHNLDYLLQKGWVSELTIDRTFKTKGGTIQNAEQVKYKISAEGIDRMEAASMFRRDSVKESRINVTTINGVTVVGDGNVVNMEYMEAADTLAALAREINRADIDAELKLNAISDLEAVRGQLQKPSPSREILAAAWGGIRKAAELSGAIGLYNQAEHLMRNLFG